MKKKIISASQYIFFLFLGVFLLWYSIKGLSPENKTQLVSSLKSAKYELVAPVMLIVLFSHYVRAVRWRALIKPLGYNPSMLNVFFATILGFFFNLLFPRLGEIMKCTILSRHEKIPADKLIGTMVTERICDVICLLGIIAIAVLSQFDLIKNYFNEKVISLLYDVNGNLKLIKIALYLAVFAIIFLLLYQAVKRWAPATVKQKIVKLGRGIGAGIISIKNVQNKGLFILQSIGIWALYLFCIQMGYTTMEAVQHLEWPASFSILSFGSLAMLATQGGIGAYQYTVQKLLLLYGIEEGAALAFGWMLWIVQIGIVVIAGLLSLLLLPIINRKKHETHAVN